MLALQGFRDGSLGFEILVSDHRHSTENIVHDHGSRRCSARNRIFGQTQCSGCGVGLAASLRHKLTFDRTLPTSTEDVTDKSRKRDILEASARRRKSISTEI